jgi:hypothetical protein
MSVEDITSLFEQDSQTESLLKLFNEVRKKFVDAGVSDLSLNFPIRPLEEVNR